MKNFEKSEANSQLHEAFQTFSWYLYRATIESSFISCFLFIISDEKTLKEQWNYISTRIAALYQSELPDSFSAWNIYLTFYCVSKIDRPLQYEIENNKFSMRKIVLPNQPSLPSDNSILKLLNDVILGSSLETHLAQNTSLIEARDRTQLQGLFSEFGSIPEDNKTDSKLRREQLLDFLLERIK